MGEIGKPLYIVLGNHDVDDTDCKVLTSQMSKHGTDNALFYNNYYGIVRTVRNIKTVSIVIDTNILEISMYRADMIDNDKLHKEFKCYCSTPKANDNVYEHVLEIYNNMKRYVVELIRTHSDADNIILVGHIPFFSINEKLGKAGSKPRIFKQNQHLFNDLMSGIAGIDEIAHGREISYLCADTHNYQHMVFDYMDINSVVPKVLRINHIVSGTGGGDPDTIHCNIHHYNESVNQMVGGSVSNIQFIDIAESFGYVKFIINNHGLMSHTFEPTVYDDNVKRIEDAIDYVAMELAVSGDILNMDDLDRNLLDKANKKKIETLHEFSRICESLSNPRIMEAHILEPDKHKSSKDIIPSIPGSAADMARVYIVNKRKYMQL